MTATEAIAEGEAPSIEEARKQSRRAARKNHSQGSNVMVSASPPPGPDHGRGGQAGRSTQAGGPQDRYAGRRHEPSLPPG